MSEKPEYFVLYEVREIAPSKLHPRTMRFQTFEFPSHDIVARNRFWEFFPAGFTYTTRRLKIGTEEQT